MKIILGSQSASRRALLKHLVPEFESWSADIDEKAIRSDDYELLPLLLARAKADVLVPRILEPALLITADQVVIWQGELREKPASPDEARRYLESYSVAPAQTNTAVVVHNTQTGQRYEGIDIARAYFRPIPPPVIDQLLKEGHVMETAGGFLIEDLLLAPYLDHIEGEKESIMGLPMDLTKQLLKQAA